MSDSTTNAEGESTADFMSTYGTHIAAVGVGVLVTLLLVGKMKHTSGDGNKESTKTATTASSTNNTAKKTKNKNNKKKKATVATATTNGVAARGVPPENDQTKESVSFADAVKEESATASATATAEPATKGKKKKNKKKNGAASNGNSNANNENKPSAQNGSSSAPVTMTPALAAAPPAPASFYDYDPRQIREQEEVWETIPNNKSKNKNKKKDGAAVKTPATAAAPATTGAKAAPTQASVTVTIDAKEVGIIIGPKGATMQAIQTATGCKLDVNAPSKDEKPNPRSTKVPKATVVISSGDNDTVTAEQMNKAKQAVLELASRGYATLLQADTFGEQTLSVHPRCLAEIVGPGGSTIQAIQNTLNVKITIPKTDWKPNTPQIGNQQPSCKVGIAGDDKQNVKKAKQTITDLLKYHHTEITHPGMIHEEVYVPQEFVHCVVGKRGSEIKHIKGNYKVQVYMADSQNENCIVVGKQSNVDKAISYIQLLMERDSEQRAQKYSDEYYG